MPAVNPTGDFEPVVLSQLLNELEQMGVVKVVRNSDRERISLPSAVWLLPIQKSAAIPQRMPPWHPSLRDLSEHWLRATPKQRAAYRAVNRWLLSDPDTTAVPIRERALEIFGRFGTPVEFPTPEKTFDTLRSGPLFSDTARLHAVLHAFTVPPPLLAERFEGGEGYYQKVGTGRVLLVIENATTWWSIVRSLPPRHALGYVAWGLGNTFVSSITSLHVGHEVSEIRYFGDLDLSGLRIPLAAAQVAGRIQLPSVRPASRLYAALQTVGVSWPGKERVADPHQAAILAQWLDPQQREGAAGLLTRGERLAQEWVGLRYLTHNQNWYSDVR
ncbi:hypothetical protein Q3V37_17450 [Micromonospora profundi]|uniref:Wadjet protein JetD C-terminal domain-containing protein n=1 Tax=Micromonospora profundi TaxID=1420889 RepID=A0AAJ6HNE3_9ACTN|nr:hypothetical protein [Micromonospora profundi]WLS43207.1 hypothetical protein Q3V37_17450 [Micromonospora profundi]